MCVVVGEVVNMLLPLEISKCDQRKVVLPF